MAEIDDWLYEPGLPDSALAVEPRSDAFVKVDAARMAWQSGEIRLADLPVDDWSVHQWRHFLSGLQGALDAEAMALLDARFGLTEQQNYEILFLWLMRSIETRYEPGIQRLEHFLIEVGRNKFTRPLYAALAETEWGRPLALDVYSRAKAGYHPLTRQASEAALDLSPDEAGP